MENNKSIKTPTDIVLRMQIVHLGKILFNLQFIFVTIMVASILTFILPAIYYLILFIVAAITLFSLFANSTFRSLWSNGEVLTQVANYLSGSWKYTIPLVLIFSIMSIACLCFDKNKKHTARILLSGILFVVSIIILILKLVNA